MYFPTNVLLCSKTEPCDYSIIFNRFPSPTASFSTALPALSTFFSETSYSGVFDGGSFARREGKSVHVHAIGNDRERHVHADLHIHRSYDEGDRKDLRGAEGQPGGRRTHTEPLARPFQFNS